MKRDRVKDAAERRLPPCTVCGAGRGDPCRSPSSKTCAPHSTREQLWNKQEVAQVKKYDVCSVCEGPIDDDGECRCES